MEMTQLAMAWSGMDCYQWHSDKVLNGGIDAQSTLTAQSFELPSYE